MKIPSGSRLAYDDYIAGHTSDFTERAWVFRRIEDWLSNAGGARTFLLTGRPGTGKTAIAARLVQMSRGAVDAQPYPALGKDSLAYFHFCQAGLDSTLSPLRFVQEFSQALANRHAAFRTALVSAASRQFDVRSEVNVQGDVQAGAQVIGTSISEVRIEIKGTDPRPLFDEAVRRPLQAMGGGPGEQRILVLVDSLDEALTFGADSNIVHLLGLVADFPPQVRFLLTCRSNADRVFDVVGPPSLDLVADSPAGLDEVRLYAASRLRALPQPGRDAAAQRVAEKSKGNFLYAYHVLNDLTRPGADIGDMDDLPDGLEDAYRKFLKREGAPGEARWRDLYQPVLGQIAVARGDGLTKAQLTGIANLAEDKAAEVLETCGQYLVGGEADGPYRIYHQSFRDFLLSDEKFTVYPAERHAAIARYLVDACGGNWKTCKDSYALQYTPAHWADAATLSALKREERTQALIGLVSDPAYQRRFERRIGDLPALHEHLRRAIQVAALNEADRMLPWIIRAAQAYVAFRHDFLHPEAVVELAAKGKLDQAEARLRLFTDLDEHWQVAASLIIAWLGAGQNAAAAGQIRERMATSGGGVEPLPLLLDRVKAALDGQPTFAFEAQAVVSLDVAKELVKRVSGQAFDRELLLSVNPSLIAIRPLGEQSELIAQQGYAAGFDAPILVNAARQHGPDGTRLLDAYIDAHAGYNYIEYRNRSLWIVLHAVLRHHPDQLWVKERLQRILVAALSGGGVDFREMLPLAAELLRKKASKGDVRSLIDDWRSKAIAAADKLQHQRGVDDSWGSHKRRLAAIMELYQLVLGDSGSAKEMLQHIGALPGGFAGFQTLANLRLADALRACGLGTSERLPEMIEQALVSAHHIQDYHFCARLTARCNALKRWHGTALDGEALADTIRRFAAAPAVAEFAADHRIGEPYQYRDDNGPDTLPIANARHAETLEELIEIFQRSAVEFRRLNAAYGLTDKLAAGTSVRVPDPGLAPLLAVHFGARVLADDTIEDEQAALLRALVPVAAANPAALDTVQSYLLIASSSADAELLARVAQESGAVAFADAAPPPAQIGPDAAIPA